jgi:hypothetical protein
MSGAEHSFVKAMGEEFYTLGESNHEAIIASDKEMSALKALTLKYCKEYNNV